MPSQGSETIVSAAYGATSAIILGPVALGQLTGRCGAAKLPRNAGNHLLDSIFLGDIAFRQTYSMCAAREFSFLEIFFIDK